MDSIFTRKSLSYNAIGYVRLDVTTFKFSFGNILLVISHCVLFCIREYPHTRGSLYFEQVTVQRHLQVGWRTRFNRLHWFRSSYVKFKQRMVCCHNCNNNFHSLSRHFRLKLHLVIRRKNCQRIFTQSVSTVFISINNFYKQNAVIERIHEYIKLILRNFPFSGELRIFNRG